MKSNLYSVFGAVANILFLSAFVWLQGCGVSDLSRGEALQLLKSASIEQEVEKIDYKKNVPITIKSELDYENYSGIVKDYLSGDKDAEKLLRAYLGRKYLYFGELELIQLYRILVKSDVIQVSTQYVDCTDKRCKNHILVEAKLNSPNICLPPKSSLGTCYYPVEDCTIEEVTKITGQDVDRNVEYVSQCTPTLLAIGLLGRDERKVTRTARFHLGDDGWRIREEEVLGSK